MSHVGQRDIQMGVTIPITEGAPPYAPTLGPGKKAITTATRPAGDVPSTGSPYPMWRAYNRRITPGERRPRVPYPPLS